MAGGFLVVGYPTKVSLRYLFFTSILGIVVGLVMLFFPGGTMTFMTVGFRILQGILTIFILYYTVFGAIHFFKRKYIVRGIAYLLIGIIFTAMIWLVDEALIFFVVSFLLLVIGITEIVGAFSVPEGRFFLALLGIIDIMIAVVIFTYPVVLALLIAWYILFWGISRLFLYLELKKVVME